jgi:hypothetical protein
MAAVTLPTPKTCLNGRICLSTLAACRGLVLRGDISPAANWRAPAIWVHNSNKADILRPAQPRSAEPAR